MNLTHKVLGLSLAAVVGFASSTFADDSGVGKSKSLTSRIAELEAKLKDAGGAGVRGSGIKISGYVESSYLVNLSDNDALAGGGLAPAGGSNNNVGRVFDIQKDSFNLNAVKLTIEKGKDSSRFPAGFRVDTIYGEDAKILNGSDAGQGSFAPAAASPSVGDSSFFLEQAYINLGLPVGNGIDVKVGKMVTLIGYEVIESPANWQFSRSDAFRLAPFTQTGVTAGYQWTDWATTTVGVINGFDAPALNGTATGAANLNTDYSFVGRLDISGPKTSFGEFNGFVAGLYGNDNFIAGAGSDNSANISIVNVSLSWGKPFNVKPLALGVEWLQRVDSGISTGGAGAQSSSTKADAIGAYAAWTWNKWLTTSARYSNTWYDQSTNPALQANSLSPFTGQFGAVYGAPQTYQVSSFTLTQAVNVWKDTLVRLEWRHDWTDLNPAFRTTAAGAGGVGFGTFGAAGADARDTQDTIAVNLVYSF
jgi:hypothetical protein